MEISTLSLDLETRSGADISECGVYRYAEDNEFDILLFGVSVNGGPVTVYDLACGETVPEDILRALPDPAVKKSAFNASFERVCLSRWLRKRYPELLCEGYLKPESWRCTMILAAYNGLPLSLEKVGEVMNLEERKMKEGRELIRYFCTPCRPTKTNGGRRWNLPEHASEKWRLFRAYNARDVEVEMQIQERLRNYPMPESVWEEYWMDQEINDRGIRIDQRLVSEALAIDEITRTDLTGRMKEITGLENPNSVIQLKGFLAEHGMEMETLGKKEVASMMNTAPEELAEVLGLRLQAAKSSVKKYTAMRNACCADGRCRGMFQFYGANRTGRWAGRLIQLQNLPQNHMRDLESARQMVKDGDYEMLKMLYSSVPGVLSELIRTAFIPREGYKFIVADYSAIEARVLSFLAREQWRIDVFHAGRDIYCESASKMFGVRVVKDGENGHLRQKGKICELALGYGGGIGALKAMGAEERGISEEEMQALVNMWREANPNIVQYWRKVDAAVKDAIRLRIPQRVGNIRFQARNGMLFITLPSGRRLSYVKPMITENRFGGESFAYMELDSQKHWTRTESYGAKVVENLIQAISRDLLANAMRTLRGYRIVGHVHDELIIEAPMEEKVETVCEMMGRTPEWIRGLELRADGYECGFYRKS